MSEFPPLPDEMRATLPPPAPAYVTALEVAVTQLQTENAALRTRAEALEVRLRRDSANSSRPPSTGPPGRRPAPTVLFGAAMSVGSVSTSEQALSTALAPVVAEAAAAAQQALRPAVLWRKGSFGTHSDAGSRFVERMLTVTASCRQHRRDLFGLLVEALTASMCGAAPPSLVPVVST